MARQWLKYCSLTVQTEKKKDVAIDLSAFRVRFEITQAVNAKPCTATIIIYNVGQETVNKIPIPSNVGEALKDEKIKIILAAGYEEDHGIIFVGDLWWKSQGRENETDTFLKLIASSGDLAQVYSYVNRTLQRGALQDDVRSVLALAFKKSEVEQIQDIKLSTAAYLRGKVLYGNAPSLLSNFAATNNFDWGYGLNGIKCLSRSLTKDDDETVYVINQNTGMIGRPELTSIGVQMRCLLNPHLEIGTLVQIENKTIQFKDYDTSWTDGAANSNTYESTTTPFDPSGLYRVISRVHRGDTRGKDWYTDLILLGVDGRKPIDPNANNFIQN